MSDCNCPGCWEEQRRINDQYQQIKKDAQTLASNTNKQVAIYIQGTSYAYSIIDGDLPANTREIIKPV